MAFAPSAMQMSVDNHARDDAIRFTFATFGPAAHGRLFELTQKYLNQYYHRATAEQFVVDPGAPVANCGPLLCGGLDVYRHILSFLPIEAAYYTTSLLSKELRKRALPTICAGRAVTRAITGELLRATPFLRAAHLKWEYPLTPLLSVPLPAWTTHITMSSFDFMQCLTFNQFFGYMVHIRKLDLSDDSRLINEPIYNLLQATLPPRLEELQLPCRFNSELPERFLPPTLKVLTFGFTFNQPIGEHVLPDSLEVLRFGTMYHQDIGPNVLPPNLLELYIGDMFNRPLHSSLAYVLPRKLRVLVLPDCFEILPGDLPPELRTLVLGWHKLVHPLPPTLTELTLHSH
jgi:hypothetical protein